MILNSLSFEPYLVISITVSRVKTGCFSCAGDVDTREWITTGGIFTNSAQAVSDSYLVANYLHSSVRTPAHSTTLDCLLDPSLNMTWMASLPGFLLPDRILIFPCLSICRSPVLNSGHTVSSGNCFYSIQCGQRVGPTIYLWFGRKIM